MSQKISVVVLGGLLFLALLVLGLKPSANVYAQKRPGEKPSVPLRPGYYIVSPEGPRDGGDFGPHTPSTRTSGIQEAFDACKRDRRDLYIVGGAAPDAFKNPGGVYALEETVRIPWMQDFRCDSGEAVLQYTRPNGDAIVMDSQMSCVYKFGLIVLLEGKADGACLRVKPVTVGPDRLVGVVTCRIAINALVGGGSRGLEKEKFFARGDGLVLDASQGGINSNEIFIHEILGCDRGIYLTSAGPATAALNNWIRCPFAHLCQTHVRLGDPGAGSGVLWNRIETLMDSHDLEGSQGVQVFGRGNRMLLSFLNVSPGKAVILESGASENLIETQNLQGRFTDFAAVESNVIRTQEPNGLGIKTPPFPDSGKWLANPYPATVEVCILDPGSVTNWKRRAANQDAMEFRGPLYSGQTFLLRPHEQLQFHFKESPQWTWRQLVN